MHQEKACIFLIEPLSILKKSQNEAQFGVFYVVLFVILFWTAIAMVISI